MENENLSPEEITSGVFPSEPPAGVSPGQKQAVRRVANRMGIGLLVYMIAAMGLGTVFQLIAQIVDPDFLNNSIELLVMNDIVTYLIGPFFMWLVVRRVPAPAPAQRSITPLRMGKLTLEAIGLMYSFSLLTSLIVSVINQLRGKELGSLLDTLTEDLPLWAMFIIMVIVAPICEEFIFRRMIYRRLQPLGTPCAVVVSGLMFGLFHCNMEQFFYASALGIFFSLVVAKTGRLRYTIALHMLLNFLGSVAVYAVEPYPTVLTVFSIALYVLMALGILVLILDRKSLAVQEHSAPGIWKSTFLAPGMLVCFIILGIAGVVVAFMA